MLLGATVARAQYVTRFSTITNGAITFTGNTLGLSKAVGLNQPGTSDAIGAFTTTNTALQVGTYPPGTTLAFAQNSSSATLTLPAGSTVLYAELTWGGTYSFGGQDVSGSRNNAITLTTPAGTSSVSPDPAFQRNLGSPNTTGACTSNCFYARTANVTALVQAGASGAYTVGAVPATDGASENTNNCAGWTLAVVYQNFSLPVRNLALFAGSELSGAAPASTAGFCTPPSGRLSGRLAVSAMEGDANKSGDTMLFGPTATLGTTNQLKGPNNPQLNFFASQINRDDGTIDTTGTFGTRNANALTATNMSGGRQGWDITNVDVSAQLRNAQTQAFAQGTTTGDTYMITDLGLQIDVGAPVFPQAKSVDKAATFVGDVLTYTTVVTNNGIVDAANVVFTDPPPPGTTFIPGSFTVNGAAQAGNPATGINIGTVAAGATKTVTFRVRVTSIPASPAPARYDATASFTYQYVSCAGQATQNGSFTTNTVTTGIARIEATKNTTPATVVAGVPLRYNITIQNTGTAPATGVTLTDPIPAGTTYIPGSTAENGIAVPDVGGTMPFALGGLVSSFGQPPGVIGPSEATTIIFFVSVDPAATGALTNSALVDPDGQGPSPAFPATVVSPVTSAADLSVTKDGPDRAIAGSNLVFTITVTNRGPSLATGVTLSDPTPPGLTFVSNSGDCTTAFPCALGNLAPRATRTITTTLSVPPGYASPDPIVNLASVTSATPDPAPDNNSAEASVGLNAPVANLTISKSNGATSVVPGRTTTYTITVSNTGPSDVAGVQVTDPQSPVLSGFTWTCSATGGASCAAASGAGALTTTVNLPAGTSATFLLTATVAAEARGEVTNTAQADSPAGVGGNSHVSGSDTDQLTPLADMSVTKAGPTNAVPGNDVVYTLVVHNAGPSSAVDVSVNDPTPPGLTFISTTGDCTTAFPCAFGTLLPGANRTIVATYAVPLGYTSPNPILNTASIVDATPDPNQSNRSTTSQTPVVLDADVAVSKSVTPTTALVGDTVTMFVSVLNNGPNGASSVAVTDVLPAGLSFVSASPQQGTYVPSSGQWQVGDLQNGANATLTITALVTQPGVITNTATKTAANEPDPNTSNDSAIATLNAAASADVAVQKTVDNPTPSVGQNVTFRVTARNTGPSDASGVAVADPLPAGLTLVSATAAPGTYDAGTGTWTVGALPVSASGTLTLVASVNTPGIIVNTASKTAQTEADPNPANDRSSISLNAIDTADIQVAKAISDPAPAVDQQVTFIVTATNLGPTLATGVAVTDQLPAGLTFVSATPSQGDYDLATGVWTVGSITASKSAVLSLTALVTQTAAFTNTASKTAGNEPDPNPDNDSASIAATASRVADLSVTKTDAVDSVVAGLTDTYTITVANAGPSAVTGASVVDSFPAALTGVTWTCTATDGGICAAASGTGDIATTADLPAGASATFTATGTVAPDATGTLANTASVTPPAGTTDPTPGDETASDSTTITPSADVQVAKSATPFMVTAGNTATFTIDVTNAGPSTATDVVITDPPPAGLAFGTITGACAAFPCTVPILAPGASATITATLSVPSPYSGPDPIVNAATASSATTDPVPANDVGQASVSVLAPVADLTVAKSNGTTSVIPGSRTTYTITVTNTGPDPVSGARVKDDPLPAALTGATWTCTASGPTGASCGQPSGSGPIDATVNLPVGATATFVLQGTVSPDATGTLVNTASAEDPPGIGDPTPSIATDTDALTPHADVSVTKTGPATVVPGNVAVYTIVVTNSGPSTATNVVVNDPTPSGLTFESNSGACTTAFPCALGALAPGATQTITTSLLVPPGDTTPSPIVEIATVSSLTTDPTPGNNTATAETTVDTDADVEVTKSVAPTTGILVGDTVTFTVQAKNNGPNAATGVVVTDILPAGLSFLSAAPTQGTYTDSSGEWVVSSLDAGKSAQLTIQALVTAPGNITNLALKTGGNEPDPNPGNDSGGATINAATAADVTLQKTVDNATPSAGDSVTFTVTATNRGPSAATGIVAEDALPPGLTLVSATPSQGAFDRSSGTWTIGDLDPSTSTTLTLVASVDTTGALVNTARKTAQTEVDPNPLNDEASVSLNATETADIGVGKASSPLAPAVGQEVTFTVTATNHGPSPATGAVVTDQLPAGLTFVSATASQGTYDASSGAWTVGDLAASRSALLSITALVKQGGAFTNTASRTASTGTDPNPANDSASVSGTADVVADLSITKTDGRTLSLPGQPVTYTITVTNAGPSNVAGATVSDPFPQTLTGATWTCTTTAGGSCGAASGTGDIATTVDLPADGKATFTATATVSPDATGAVTNSAGVRAPPGTTDPDSTNNDAPDLNALPADLAIAKSGPLSAPSGALVAYGIVVRNAGPGDAADVVVADPTPPGLAFLANTGACATAFPCELGTIASGDSRTIVATYTALGSAGTSALNTAAVASPIFDPDPANNFSRVATQLVAPPPPTSTTSTTPAGGTTSTTTSSTTTTATTVASPTTTLPAAELCSNCLDDDGNGLIDAEDPACCTAEPLTVTQARFRPGKSTLRVDATLTDGTFAGLDPRHQNVRLQIRTAEDELVCCTISQEQWQKLFGRHYGFFDQKMTHCPPIRCVRLVVPKQGPARATIIVGRVKPGSPMLSPLEITMSADNQCAAGSLTPQPKRNGGGVFR